MIAEYHPFTRKENKKTEHGWLNYTNSLGSSYITHRKPEHFFKKFSGFAISLSELEIVIDNKIRWIVIMYHRKNGTNILYRIRTEDIALLEEYENNGDYQKVFPLNIMQRREMGSWE